MNPIHLSRGSYWDDGLLIFPAAPKSDLNLWLDGAANSYSSSNVLLCADWYESSVGDRPTKAHAGKPEGRYSRRSDLCRVDTLVAYVVKQGVSTFHYSSTVSQLDR